MKLKNQDQKFQTLKMLARVQYGISAIGILSAGLGIFVLSQVTAGRDISGIKQSSGWMIALLSIFVLLFLLAAILIRVWGSRAILHPIERIAEASKCFSKGDLSQTIGYQSRSELGTISSSLDTAFLTLNQDVEDITLMLDRMSQGDLTAVLKREFEGDFAPISQSFQQILNRLNQTFAVIQSTANQVDDSAHQISDTAQELAQGATEQAASAEELSSSAEEISSSIQETSGHISNVATYMEETTADINESNEKMKEMLSAMEKIDGSSGEIKKIIKVIDEIAFQTNILALNAAVEASRAGEAGKGFAVVADEVRALAGKSANAASQTTALIEECISRVKDGTDLANHTAKALTEVAVRVNRVNESVEKINAAAASQSTAAEQISQSIEQISSVVQTNSASAEESAAASEELTGQADLLKNELKRFRVRKNT